MIVLVLRKIDLPALGAILIRADFRLVLLGSVLTLPMIVGLAARWRIFLRQQQLRLPFKVTLGLTWSGQFFNSVLPGSTGGDFVKIYQLCRLMPDQKAAAAVAVFTDRLSAFVALALLAAASFFLDPTAVHLIAAHMGGRTVAAGLIIAALFGAVVIWLLFRARQSARWSGRLTRLFAAARSSLTPSWPLGFAFVLAILLHLINFLIAFLFARSLRIGITYQQIVVIMPAVMLLVMLPLTINGHGLREVLLIVYFTQMPLALPSGVTEAVVGFSVILVTNDLLWALPGGLWYLLRVRSASPYPRLASATP